MRYARYTRRRKLRLWSIFTLAETPLTVRLAYSEVRLVSLLIRSTQYSMRISLKDTQIAGYWATARKNTLDDCVSELHHFMTSLESLYPGGHWRIMREAPQRLGANVENAIPGLTDLLLGQLEGANSRCRRLIWVLL